MHLFNALVSSLLVAAAVAAGIPGSGAQALGKRACDPANCIAQCRPPVHVGGECITGECVCYG